MDREKVIKGLEVCVDRAPGKYTCNECPYEIDGNYCEINLAKDAIAILKEQEEVIRCKDCKWHDNADDSPKWLPCIDMKTSPDWFCASGEHKVNK